MVGQPFDASPRSSLNSAPVRPRSVVPQAAETDDDRGPKMITTERRAWFVYEAARTAAIAARASIIPDSYWDRDEAFRAQFVQVVERQCGPDRQTSPVDLHADWVRAYKAMGWVYGPVRDPEQRTHPDLVPYQDLDQLERDKDAVFVALCEIARQWIYGDSEVPSGGPEPGCLIGS
jgi:hypothetical protein